MLLFYESEDAVLSQNEAQWVSVSPTNNCSFRSAATLSAEAGKTYYLAVVGTVDLTLTLTMALAPPNDDPSDAIVVTTSNFTDANIAFSNAQSNSVPAADQNDCTIDRRDVFYTFTATTAGEVTVSRAGDGSGFIIFYESDNATLTRSEAQRVTVTPNNDCTSKTTATLTAEAGTTYYVAVTSFGEDSVTFTSTAALPVELTAFTATVDGDAAHLAWETASETNNAGFRIEHWHPGDAAWTERGFAYGHGTTLEAQRYRFTAEGLVPGSHRFRLRQVDYDGTFEYSPEIEVSVELAEAFQLSEAYPNPFNPEANVMLSVRNVSRCA
ncbi:MAG: hypothetical protein RhofKO_17070 [Rhodothermales bacterium]